MRSGERLQELRAEIRARETAVAREMAAQAVAIAALHDMLHSASDPGDDPNGDPNGEPHPGWEREILMSDLRLGRGQADDRIRTALDLRDRLPRTAGRLESGELSWAHAAGLSRATAKLADELAAVVESKVLDDAKRVTPWQVEERARRLAAGLLPLETVPSALEVHERRNLDAFLIDGVEGALSGRFSPEDLATITTAINERAKPAGDDDHRTIGQLRADALVDLCAEDLAGTPSGAVHGGNPVQLVVDVPLDALLLANSTTPTAEAATVRSVGEAFSVIPVTIGPRVLARLACDAEVWRLVREPVTGHPLAYGRSMRTPPPALRHAVLARDEHHCMFPGCAARRRLEIHHLRHWAHDGPTCPDNLLAVCARHHRAVHDAGWSASFDGSGALHWSGPAGATAPTRLDDLSGLYHLDAPEPEPVPPGGQPWVPWHLTTRRRRLEPHTVPGSPEPPDDPPF